MSEDSSSGDVVDLLGMIEEALDGSIDSDSKSDDFGDLYRSQLAEDFNFFVKPGDPSNPEPQKEPTLNDIKQLYAQLKRKMKRIDRKLLEIESEEILLNERKAKFEAELALWNDSRRKQEREESEWKQKYHLLKEEFDRKKKEWKEKTSMSSSASGFAKPDAAPVQSVLTPQTKSPAPSKSPVKHKPRAMKPPKLSARLQPPASPPAKPISKEKKKMSKPIPVVHPTGRLHEKYRLDFKFNPGTPISQDIKPNGRCVIRYRNGVIGTNYGNGTKKVKTGEATYIFYENGDISITFIDGAHAYRYAESKTIELQIPDGTKIIQFADGQREKHLTNGDKEIMFTDGTLKKIPSER